MTSEQNNQPLPESRNGGNPEDVPRDCIFGRKIEGEQARATTSKTRSARLMALDAFRGLTIAGMLLVNNIALGEHTPRTLRHAPWNGGINFADLVFPWFLLIVGVAIPYARESSRRRGLPTWKYDIHAIQRAAILVILGCLVDSSVEGHLHLGLGVLQLIGLAYMAGAFISQLHIITRLSVAGALLIGYWAIIRFVPIPGVGAGIFHENLNVIEYVNHTYLASIHLQGLLSVIPATAMVLIGSGIGQILRCEWFAEYKRVAIMTAVGVGLMLVGYLWNLDLPYNKIVWTPSYILYTAGLGSAILGVFYLVTDVWRWRWWALPLTVFGANAIIAYVTPIFFRVYLLEHWMVRLHGGAHRSLLMVMLHGLFSRFGHVVGGWIYTVSYIVFWWLILSVLYRRKIFLKI